MKADLLTRRAQFDRQANRAFKASKMTAEEFLESDQYQAMRDKYDEELASIAMGERRFQMGRRPEATPAAAPAAATAPAAPAAASASRPRTPPQSPDPRLAWDQTLNNGAGGWRRKKQGE
jgi:biotin carboxylase